jgi:hypothetical protein
MILGQPEQLPYGYPTSMAHHIILPELLLFQPQFSIILSHCSVVSAAAAYGTVKTSSIASTLLLIGKLDVVLSVKLVIIAEKFTKLIAVKISAYNLTQDCFIKSSFLKLRLLILNAVRAHELN